MRTYGLCRHFTLVLAKIEIFHIFMFYDLCDFILNLLDSQRFRVTQRGLREKSVFISIVLGITIIVKSFNTLIYLLLDDLF